MLDFFLYRSFLKTPSVIGAPLATALEIFSSHNLNARLLSYKEDHNREPGIVLHQNPSPLSSIRPQQTVFLVVSSLPACAKTPTCIGKSYTENVTGLKEHNISHTIYYVPSNYPKGTCIAQLPKPDSDLPKTGLILYLAKDSFYTSFLIPSFTKRPLAEVASFLKEQHLPFTVFHARPTKEGHTCTNCIITAQKPLAGSCLHKNNPLTIQLQVND